ncbi:MAG: ribosome assembly cofactor RimP [Flavobacteriaceae bacterium]|nr:ribosome assembly cofactor RimP [Flavobacteriaceae bacterium]
MDKEAVKRLVREALEENEELFLIELSFSGDNKILVEVDGDSGVNLKECMRISRHVEHNLDREEEDFGLEVTSPDVANPLKVLRQYQKNIGRILTVKTKDNKTVEGTLTEANEKKILLEWKAREPKPIGKGKITVEKTAEIAYNNIQEAKVKIIFN